MSECNLQHIDISSGLQEIPYGSNPQLLISKLGEEYRVLKNNDGFISTTYEYYTREMAFYYNADNKLYHIWTRDTETVLFGEKIINISYKKFLEYIVYKKKIGNIVKKTGNLNLMNDTDFLIYLEELKAGFIISAGFTTTGLFYAPWSDHFSKTAFARSILLDEGGIADWKLQSELIL